MLQEGLEHDQITVNQMGNKATATEQLDNQKFIHEPMTLYLWKLSHSREKDDQCNTGNSKITYSLLSREAVIY